MVGEEEESMVVLAVHSVTGKVRGKVQRADLLFGISHEDSGSASI